MKKANWFWGEIVPSKAFNSTEICRDLRLLFPPVRRKVLAIVSDLWGHGQEVTVFETYRSQERQAQLFRQGVTQLRNVGVHHYGLAADIVRIVDGQPNWDVDHSLVVRSARAHGLISGADWGFPNRTHSIVDPYHVQLCSIRDQQKLFNHTWFPDERYEPYAHL